MKLKQELENARAKLEKMPSLEEASSVKPAAAALEKALSAFNAAAGKHEVTSLPEYAELSSLMANSPVKNIVTIAWMNQHLRQAGQPEIQSDKAKKKEKETFLHAMVSAHKAQAPIKELCMTPNRLMQDDFARLAAHSPPDVRKYLKSAYTANRLTAFCKANGVEVPKKKKNVTADQHRAQVVESIIRSLEAFNQRQQL